MPACPARWLLAAGAGAVVTGLVAFLVARIKSASAIRRLLAGVAVVVLLAPLATLRGHRAPELASSGEHAVQHVILIIIDTLRADMLRSYNPSAPPTPNLDAFAASAIKFDGAIAPASWTLPSMATIFTGLPASVHGAVTNRSRLPSNMPTLTRRMKGAGYATAAIVDNPALTASRGLDAGFDIYDQFPRRTMDTSLGTFMLSRLFVDCYREELTTELTTDRVSSFVQRHAEKDFFLWAHYYDPHGPYAPPERFLPEGTPPARFARSFSSNNNIRLGTVVTTPEEEAWIRRLYEGEVRYVDESIGRLMGRMRDAGVYDDALIIITSDHGDEFREHGGVAHGHTLYNELNPRAAAGQTARHDGRAHRARRGVSAGAHPRHTLAVWTRAARSRRCGGVAARAHRRHRGRGTHRDYLQRAVPLYYGLQDALIFDSHKYIRHRHSGREELFHLGFDPGEAALTHRDSPRRGESCTRAARRPPRCRRTPAGRVRNGGRRHHPAGRRHHQASQGHRIYVEWNWLFLPPAAGRVA